MWCNVEIGLCDEKVKIDLVSRLETIIARYPGLIDITRKVGCVNRV